MKILIISDAWLPQVNGVVRTYQHMGAELRAMGHEIQVIGPSSFKWTMPMPGYSEIRLVLFPGRCLKRLIAKFDPDRIHVSTEGPLGRAGRRYCLRRGIPFSTSYHTHFPDYVAKRVAKYVPFLYGTAHFLAKAMVRSFHARSSAMMVATQSLEDELRSWDFKNPMHRLLRGAKLDLFQLGEKTLFHDLPGPVALYVGRVAIEKNLEAFLSMDWEGSKVVVGDGPALASLRQAYPDAIFVGNREGEDLAAHYRSADLFAFPSRTDTFGMVLVEAMASGLPIAAYDVTGPKDIVTEDFLGALHADDLGLAAKEALGRGTPEQRAQHARDYYTWDYVARQFLDAQERLIPPHK